MRSRLIWVTNTIAGGRDEERLRRLFELAPVDFVLSKPERLLETMPGVMDTVVVDNAEQPVMHGSIGYLRGLRPAPTVLLRATAMPVPADSSRADFVGLEILDGHEGLELTRSRVLAAMPHPAKSPVDGAVPGWRRNLIGQSRAIQKVAEVVRLVGPRRCTVLITGETGTGKEMAARAIHMAGPRHAAPYVALNCSAVPTSLLESELFGHTRGAFTGATQLRVGRFEQAQGGTLFLDEIGELPVELQAKLLRVLQEREFQRVGSSENVRVEARVIAATNQNLRRQVALGAFREDLFYRLNVVPLELPPLRARMSDVRLLAEHFVKKICSEEQIAAKGFTPDAWKVLESYDWPGNVRQLENAIASAVILSESRAYLDADDFSFPASESRVLEGGMRGFPLPEHGLDFTEAVNEMERSLLSQALKKTGGNKKAAAEMLRLKRTTLAAKVRVLEIQERVA